MIALLFPRVEVVIVMFNQICKEVTLKKLSEFLLFFFFLKGKIHLFLLSKRPKRPKRFRRKEKASYTMGLFMNPLDEGL
jgi:hypothetical protein